MVKKKHILFIVENAPVPLDRRVWSEAQAAKEFGYEVTIISPAENNSFLRYEKTKGIEIYRHPKPFEAYAKFAFLFEYLNALFWEFFYSIRVFAKKPFHIIHSANPPDHVFLIALFFKLFGTKFIFDHHDISPETYIAKFGKKDPLYKILLVMEKLTFQTADIVISTNDSYKNIALTRGNKRNDDVFVVRNGPDLSVINSMKQNETLKEGFEYLVAYVGVIGDQERIDVLLKAVQYIVYRKQMENIKFIIIGAGSHWEKMVQLSKDMKLEKYVNFTGYIPYPGFHDILASADVCVNPEPRNEYTDKSTMIKIMEYMISGKAIVQFETTEGKVTAGGAAVNINNNDKIEFAETIIELLKDPEKREKMGEIGKKRIHEELNWDIQKINLKKAYEHLEAKGSRFLRKEFSFFTTC